MTEETPEEVAMVGIRCKQCSWHDTVPEDEAEVALSEHVKIHPEENVEDIV